MALTHYVVQLYSEGEPQYISGVAELKEANNSIYLYGENDQLIAVYEKNDIQKLAPLSQ